MLSFIRSALVWILALFGVSVFAWFVIASGMASIDATEPPVLTPPALQPFGMAAGALLATNLGAFLGIAIKTSGNGGFRAVQDAQTQPWAQLVGAIAYLGVLGIAVFFYWRSGFNENGAEVITQSLATAFGVCLGAMTSVFNAKP